MFTLFGAINDLKLLPRTGWLYAGIRQPESVADHCYATTVIAMALADVINLDPAAHGLAAPLDVERLLRMAVLHDLAESRVTDLPRRATEILGESIKHDAERRALESILADFAPSPAWLSSSDDYAQNSTQEARLLHDADKLEMTFQAARYLRTGVRDLNDFLASRPYAFALCARLHDEIVAAALPAQLP